MYSVSEVELIRSDPGFANVHKIDPQLPQKVLRVNLKTTYDIFPVQRPKLIMYLAL